MQFSQVLGQENLKKQFINAAKIEKPAHAILLNGKEGNGAFSLALAYAKFLNCENRQENESCGTCNSCNKNQKLIHPDVTFSFPVYRKNTTKPAISNDFINEWRNYLNQNKFPTLNQWMKFIADENKQGNISADECNGIIKKVSLKHFEAKYKIVILYLAELLNKDGNRLLKIIEEPPANTIFILITNNLEKILPTIKSRTQIVNVPAYSDQEIENYLLNNFQIEKAKAAQIAILADGNVNLAINLCENENNNYSEIMLSWFRYTFKQDTSNINNLIDQIGALKREGQKHFINYCINLLRDTLVYSFANKNVNRLSPSENKLITFLTQKVNFTQIEELVNSFDKLFYYIERNGNARIQFFHLYTKHIEILNR